MSSSTISFAIYVNEILINKMIMKMRVIIVMCVFIWGTKNLRSH